MRLPIRWTVAKECIELLKSLQLRAQLRIFTGFPFHFPFCQELENLKRCESRKLKTENGELRTEKFRMES